MKTLLLAHVGGLLHRDCGFRKGYAVSAEYDETASHAIFVSAFVSATADASTFAAWRRLHNIFPAGKTSPNACD
jgi:hypothetical protein